MGGAGGNPEVVRMMREQQRAAQRRQEARRLRNMDRRKARRDPQESAEAWGQVGTCGRCGTTADLSQLYVVDPGFRCGGCHALDDLDAAVTGANGDWGTHAWLLAIPQLTAAAIGIQFPVLAAVLAVGGVCLGAAGVDLAWRLGVAAPTWARWGLGTLSAVCAMGWVVAGIVVYAGMVVGDGTFVR